VEKSDATKPMLEKAGIDTEGIVDVKSTLVDDGESQVANFAGGAIIALVADDVTGIGVADDILIPVAAIVATVATLAAGDAIYEFATEHTSNKRKSTWNKHTKTRSGQQRGQARNSGRGNKNKKYKKKDNPNKRK